MFCQYQQETAFAAEQATARGAYRDIFHDLWEYTYTSAQQTDVGLDKLFDSGR